jgi:hypothetical protein
MRVNLLKMQLEESWQVFSILLLWGRFYEGFLLECFLLFSKFSPEIPYGCWNVESFMLKTMQQFQHGIYAKSSGFPDIYVTTYSSVLIFFILITVLNPELLSFFYYFWFSLEFSVLLLLRCLLAFKESVSVHAFMKVVLPLWHRGWFVFFSNSALSFNRVVKTQNSFYKIMKNGRSVRAVIGTVL